MGKFYSLTGLFITATLVGSIAASSALAESVCKLDNFKGSRIIILYDGKDVKDIRKVNIKIYNLVDKLTLKSKTEKQGKQLLQFGESPQSSEFIKTDPKSKNKKLEVKTKTKAKP